MSSAAIDSLLDALCAILLSAGIISCGVTGLASSCEAVMAVIGLKID